MSYYVKDIAAALGAGFEGDGDFQVSTVAEPAHAKPDQIALATSPKYAEELSLGNAGSCRALDWRRLAKL